MTNSSKLNNNKVENKKTTSTTINLEIKHKDKQDNHKINSNLEKLIDNVTVKKNATVSLKNIEIGKIQPVINKTEEMLNFMSSDINLSNLKRPFSIKFNEIKLKESLTSNIETNDNLTVISLKCIIMCGGDKFSNKRKVIWRGFGKDLKHAIINKRIYFETKYCDLPM